MKKTMLLLLVAFTLVISCKLFEPGLGKKVDVETPLLSINSPTNGEYVSGEITILGTYDEDTGVSSIGVSVDGGTTFLDAVINTSASSWSYTFDSTELESGDGELNVIVKITDTDDKSTQQQLLLRIDNTPPLVLVKNPQGYSSGVFNGDITLSGEAADLFGIESVDIEYFNTSGGDHETTVASGTNNWSFIFNSGTLISESGEYGFIITAEDYAGNVSSVMYHYNDILADNENSSFTAENWYLYTLGLTPTVPFSTTIDTNGFSSYQILQMDLDIDQSLDLPQFIISNPDPTATPDENVLPGNARAIGMVTDDDGVQTVTETIEICLDPANTSDPDDAGNTWVNADTVSGTGLSVRWEHDLSALSDGSHTIWVRAEDIYGTENNSQVVSFSIDRGAPEITVNSPSQGDYMNGDYTIDITATDGDSVASVEVSLDDGATYNDATLVSGDDWEYDVTVSGDAIMKIKVRAADSTGKEAYFNLFVITDTTAPVIAFTSPASAATVNGDVTFYGTVSDGNLLAEFSTDVYVRLIIERSGTVLDADGVFNWDCTINSVTYAADTYAYSNADTGYESLPDGVWQLNVQAVVNDVAGNSGQTSGYYILINNDLDRPDITIISPEESSVLPGNGQALGMVTDDDAVETTSIEICIDPVNTSDPDDAGNVWNSVDETSGSGLLVYWEHDLSALDEGAHSLWVRAEDIYGNARNSGVIGFTIDKGAPLITINSPAQGDYLNSNFTIDITATDGDSVASVEVSLDNGVTYNDAAFVSGDDWEYDVTVSADEIMKIKVRATDSTDKEAYVNLLVIVDVTDPAIAFTSPSATSTVNGEIIFRGTANDGNQLDEGTGITLTIERSGTNLVADGMYNWEYTLNTVSYANDTYAYSNADTGYESLPDGVWQLNVLASVNDVAGNTGQTSGYYILIDNDLDKPLVNIISPDEGKILGGSVLISGTAYDDDMVHHIEMQIDVNGDGDFDDAIDFWDGVSANPGNGTTDKFEDETQWYEIDGTTSWTEQINVYGELYETETGHEGDITIRVRAVDTKDGGTTPDVSGNYAELNITLDDTIPRVENLNRVSGDYVKGTFNLTGDILDDEFVDYIGISYDGGTSYDTIKDTDGWYNATYLTQNDFDDYSLDMDIDSISYVPDSGLMYFRIKVIDDANYQSIAYINLNVDNVYPTGEWDDTNADPLNIEDEGADDRALVQGTFEDDGSVSGFGAVHVYFVDDDADGLYNPKDGTLVGTLGTALFDNGSTIGTVDPTLFFYPTSTEDMIIIDDLNEFGLDSGGNGDGDTYNEEITLSSGVYTWWATFNSDVIPDGDLIIHYVVFDPSGNGTHYQTNGFIKNNKPEITSLTVGTDLDFSGSVETGTSEDWTYTATFDAHTLFYVNIDASDDDTITSGDCELRLADNTPLTPVSGNLLDGATYNVTGGAEGDTVSLYVIVTDSDGITDTRYFSYVVDNDDDTEGPSVTFNDITTDNVVAGHVESSTESTFSNSTGIGADADISGTINLTGTLSDDQRIQNFYIAIEGYDFGGAVTAGDPHLIAAWDTDEDDLVTEVGTDLVLSTSWDSENGHTVNFTYVFNSALIPNSVAEDMEIEFTAEDFGASTADGTDSTEVDVVPYISDLETGFENGTLSYIKRSALGTYPLAASDDGSDTIVINGYNLNMASGSVTIGADALTVEDSDTTNYLWVETRKDSAVSGNLTVTVNSIDSINNTNNNSLTQNMEAVDNFPDRNDDRYMSVWGVEDQSISGVTEAVMRPNTARSDMDWMYVNNSQDLYLNSNVITSSWTLAGGDFMRNDDGKAMYIFLHNMNWSSGATEWQYHGSVQWGMLQDDDTMHDLWNSGWRYQAYYWNIANTNRLGLGNLSWDDDDEYTPATKMMGRYANLSYRLGPGSDNSLSSAYAAYYDQMTDAEGLVFYAFDVGTGATTTTSLDTEGASHYYASIEKQVDNTGYYGSPSYEVGIETPTGRVVISDTASEHFDIQIDQSTGYAYAAYYDPSAGELKFAYNTTPTSAPSAWTIRSTAIDTQAGIGVRMAVDASGGIHLAYQDSADSNLKYAYLPAYNTADGNVETYTVDALFTNGEYNSIAIRDFSGGAGTDYRPVISSFSQTYSGTRYALRASWPQASIGSISDGADASSGDYTGDWEVMTIPAGTNPGESRTYIETDGALYQGQIIVGYNGSAVEEATLYSE